MSSKKSGQVKQLLASALPRLTWLAQTDGRTSVVPLCSRADEPLIQVGLKVCTRIVDDGGTRILGQH